MAGLRFVVVFAVVAFQGGPREALAQGATQGQVASGEPAPTPASSSGSDEEAQRLADQGVAAYEKHDYPNAARLFKQAHALRADPTLLYNLAKIYEKLDDPSQALEFYRRYLVADSTDVKLRERAESRVKALSGGTAVAPGLRKGGRGQGMTAPPIEPRRPGGLLLWSGVAVAAVGVVALGAGIGLDVASSSEYSTFKGTQDELDKRASRDRAQTLSNGALAGYVVGGLLVAGGGTLLALGLKKRLGSEPRMTMWPLLVPLPGGGAAALAGRF